MGLKYSFCQSASREHLLCRRHRSASIGKGVGEILKKGRPRGRPPYSKSMNGDILLYWMSHLGEGSWTRFAEALRELDPDADHERLHRKLPVSLSDSGHVDLDRKSTRLNSSHGYISYAVFCLKKKKKNPNTVYAI